MVDINAYLDADQQQAMHFVFISKHIWFKSRFFHFLIHCNKLDVCVFRYLYRLCVFVLYYLSALDFAKSIKSVLKRDSVVIIPLDEFW